MNRIVNTISSRLSLRPPQRKSLEMNRAYMYLLLMIVISGCKPTPNPDAHHPKWYIDLSVTPLEESLT